MISSYLNLILALKVIGIGSKLNIPCKTLEGMSRHDAAPSSALINISKRTLGSTLNV